jgi:hypothetical protein
VAIQKMRVLEERLDQIDASSFSKYRNLLDYLPSVREPGPDRPPFFGRPANTQETGNRG